MDATLHSLLMHAAERCTDDKGYRYLDRRERETFRSFAELADRAGRTWSSSSHPSLAPPLHTASSPYPPPVNMAQPLSPIPRVELPERNYREGAGT